MQFANLATLKGMIEFRDALTGVIDEYGQNSEAPALPASTSIGDRHSKQVRFDNK